jgi:hypothetical protein
MTVLYFVHVPLQLPNIRCLFPAVAPATTAPPGTTQDPSEEEDYTVALWAEANTCAEFAERCPTLDDSWADEECAEAANGGNGPTSKPPTNPSNSASAGRLSMLVAALLAASVAF